MNFDEWFDGKYIKEADLFCKRQLKEAFNVGQRNCGCVHTDNTQIILNLEDKVKELKEALEEQKQYTAFKCDENKKKTEKLELQIKKMKCCVNCKFYHHCLQRRITSDCLDKCVKWELKE